MTRTLSTGRWGNRLAVRIPTDIAEDLRIDESSKLEAKVHDGQLTLTLARAIPNYTLEELIEGITPENLYPETDTGSLVGKENVD
ncbi:MAG: AbrB/MazE/SpoVT family DNA-binding domain-containing protein [Myxococcota bacterium]